MLKFKNNFFSIFSLAHPLAPNQIQYERRLLECEEILGKSVFIALGGTRSRRAEVPRHPSSAYQLLLRESHLCPDDRRETRGERNTLSLGPANPALIFGVEGGTEVEGMEVDLTDLCAHQKIWKFEII
jgi:hypothetical protein